MSKMNSNAVMNEMNDTMKHMDSTMSSMTTGLTDAELRQSPIPITGNVNATFTSNPDDLSFILISTATTNTNVLKNSAGILTNVRLNIDVNVGLLGGNSFSYLKIYDNIAIDANEVVGSFIFD